MKHESKQHLQIMRTKSDITLDQHQPKPRLAPTQGASTLVPLSSLPSLHFAEATETHARGKQRTKRPPPHIQTFIVHRRSNQKSPRQQWHQKEKASTPDLPKPRRPLSRPPTRPRPQWKRTDCPPTPNTARAVHRHGLHRAHARRGKYILLHHRPWQSVHSLF